MNINDLTIGEKKALAAMFAPAGNSQVVQADPFAGEYVICRCYAAGVHAGYLESQSGDVVVLRDSRRLWNWKAQSGVALNGVATHGIATGCKIDASVRLIRLTGVIETIICTKKGKESINV